jgi:hypothetical protein
MLTGGGIRRSKICEFAKLISALFGSGSIGRDLTCTIYGRKESCIGITAFLLFCRGQTSLIGMGRTEWH